MSSKILVVNLCEFAVARQCANAGARAVGFRLPFPADVEEAPIHPGAAANIGGGNNAAVIPAHGGFTQEDADAILAVAANEGYVFGRSPL